MSDGTMQNTAQPPAAQEEAVDLAPMPGIIERVGSAPKQVIQLLQAVQAEYRYLPKSALEYICEHTEITPAMVASVSTFYRQFRHRPAGEHTIRVCVGTPCHVKGAPAVVDGFLKALDIEEGGDTDAERRYTVEQVGCLGICTLAPVVQMDDVTYGYVQPADCNRTIAEFEKRQAERKQGGEPPPAGAEEGLPADAAELRIDLGTCVVAEKADQVIGDLRRAARRSHSPVRIKPVCFVGSCLVPPIIEIHRPDKPVVIYHEIDADRVIEVLHRHFPPRNPLTRFVRWADRALEQTISGEEDHLQRRRVDARDPVIAEFIGPQKRLVTEGFGKLDPLSVPEYRELGGFAALESVLGEWTPEQVATEVREAQLRGRGGAGFLTGLKWEIARKVENEKKYVVCNGDEGDPGAFMDRMIFEAFPFRVIEGMILQAYAVGADEGYVYVRAEYPLAVERIRRAIAICREQGLLGPDILGSGFAFDLHVKVGAGAFVCGEESALIESIEGKRGFPRLRPPYPVESGLWGKPTVVNNVETLASVPWILRNGAEAFRAYGNESSAGTKAFALAGKTCRGGLIEVPMGVTIRQIVEDIGGGISGDKQFKGVLIGGPSGGCIPARLADVPIDFQELTKMGAMMGSGGLVVLDEDDCMVDIARYFLGFTQNEACGQCSVGRIGTRRMLDILERLCAGEGKTKDIADLEELSQTVNASSLCQLCKTAPNPVLTTLRYFREEYEAHVAGRCPAGKCVSLSKYVVNDRCNGCTKCVQVCPVDAIPLTPYRKHHIDVEKCTYCDACRQICPVDAIDII